MRSAIDSLDLANEQRRNYYRNELLQASAQLIGGGVALWKAGMKIHGGFEEGFPYLASLGSVNSPSGVRDGSPTRKRIFCILRLSNGLWKTDTVNWDD